MVNGDLSSQAMQNRPVDLAQVRLDNALVLFEEFVRATARHADAATLRGLEGRFAERVQIQPSYWSQIKSRSRQIGERLARQFEQLCHKPAGWMDQPHGGEGSSTGASTAAAGAARAGGTGGVAATAPNNKPAPDATPADSAPRDDDERFIVGLVLTYYRRHPQRARTRLLDLLGEVLIPQAAASTTATPPPGPASSPGPRARPVVGAPLSMAAEDAQALWLRTQSGVSPIKRKK
jgi:hypothetical protein